MAGKNGKTRPFTAVNYSAAKLAREKQRREYEQQKKEKFIFALFVVIILVMILFAILIFKRVLGNEDPALVNETETESADTGTTDTDVPAVADAYETVTVPKSDLYAGNLLLIDSSHPYRKGDVTVTDIYSSRTQHEDATHPRGYVYSFYPSDKNVLMETEALAALNAMADALYLATDKNNDLFVRPSAAYVENATDAHATGRAVDLSGWSDDDVYYNLDDAKYTAEFSWLRENYYKYGFIRTNENGACEAESAYHFLYVGTAHAYYMYKNDLYLKDYLELLRTAHTFKNNGESNLTVVTDEGERFEIYYVAAVGDIVSIPVPSACESYSISGDNANGFVVTVSYGRTYN